MARTHGRIATYNRGCRCDDCRAASIDKDRRYRAARRDPTRCNQMCPFCGQWFVQEGNHERVHKASA